ncbi:GNAT family N-acetyltransferase [Chryseobacterium joostei]|uniref:GNAT family N-acetyltransferase n=1 Tax=Chryseobacterium joostei TaxID=112234 RepID=A0A1N7HY74_9FLAO|nr:GNAT family N-acetyltransferase [Chryseobacterium joostei]AZA98668.1 GNAT family N-acetyltransferase [Chryseobacterium joostei]SIS29678.1 Siderophore synthetase component [Chryseobacterium joostei]
MEKTLVQKSRTGEKAREITYRILLNGMLRELGNGKFYQGVPKYDLLTAQALKKSNYTLHLRFEMKKSGLFLFAPVSYRSESAFHEYGFPVWAVDHNNNKTFEVNIQKLIELIYREFSDRYTETGLEHFEKRIQSSLRNLELTTEACLQQQSLLSYSFLESEQMLPAGHNLHPFTKSRMGFSEEEQVLYGPEFKNGFQLEYFLIHKDCISEKSLPGISAKEIFGKLASIPENYDSKTANDYYVVPCHPWEAQYLQTTKGYADLLGSGKVIHLGPSGEEFFATSSIRTLYSPKFNWMLKFSLHVLMTGSVRTNSLKDLKRGYASSVWWEQEKESFEKDFSSLKLLLEPSSLSVDYNGENIDSFNILIRENPFSSKDKVLLLARLCQDETTDRSNFTTHFFNDVVAHLSKETEDAVINWFQKYAQLLISPLNRLFNQFGMAPEVHQQNLLIQLNDQLLPETIYVRDGQGYLLRESFKEKYTKSIENCPEIETLFIRDERLLDIVSHHLLVSNFSALISSIGKTGLIEEQKLINILYQEFERVHQSEPSDFTNYALHQRYWAVKSNLQSAVLDVDGGVNASAIAYAKVPNILHKYFFSEQLIHPKGKEVFFKRYFPKEDVITGMRPIDLDNDLEMLHEWFNREHAVKIWQMNWPIDELETYYRLMLPSDEAHSYIVESNDEPTCNIEVYWACRDIVGDYYEVLPTDYGTHQFIAPIDPKKKFVSPSTQSMVDYVFAQPQVGKMVGEGSVDSLASMMNKAHVGFKVEKVIEMPHKKANLNFCYREWYWEKFPLNKDVQITTNITKNE